MILQKFFRKRHLGVQRQQAPSSAPCAPKFSGERCTHTALCHKSYGTYKSYFGIACPRFRCATPWQAQSALQYLCYFRHLK